MSERIPEKVCIVISLLLSYLGITKDSFSAMQLLSLVLHCTKQIISLQVEAAEESMAWADSDDRQELGTCGESQCFQLVLCNSSSATLQQS